MVGFFSFLLPLLRSCVESASRARENQHNGRRASQCFLQCGMFLSWSDSSVEKRREHESVRPGLSELLLHSPLLCCMHDIEPNACYGVW